MSTRILGFDTETTGKADFKASYNAPIQPDLIQLGFKLVDMEDDGSYETLYEVGMLVDTSTLDPNRMWKIDPEAQNVHGINSERVHEFGISPGKVLAAFCKWMGYADIVIAHNIAFDTLVMQTFAYRAQFSPGLFEGKNKFCTMQNTTGICKIPSPKGYGYKWPRLDEAYKMLVKPEGFSGAHNALIDVDACIAVFSKLVKLNHVKLVNGNAVRTP